MHDRGFHRSFSARLSALAAINSKDRASLSEALTIIREAGETYGKYYPGLDMRALAECLNCMPLLWDWSESVTSAASDADRFLKAAHANAKNFLLDAEPTKSSNYVSILKSILAIKEVHEVKEIETKLGAAALALGTKPPRFSGIGRGKKTGKTEATEIAFVSFEIDGKQAKAIDRLVPNTLYDIRIDLRVENWPEEASRLILQPVSLLDPKYYDLPIFVFSKPELSDEVHKLSQSGKLSLNVERPFGSTPLEFKYRASFEPKTNWAADIIGHRTLKLESVTRGQLFLSGYENMDYRILEMRDEIRQVPGISSDDLDSTIRLLVGIGNIAAQSLHDGKLFPANTKEKTFQNEMKKLLRLRPDLGSELEEHPHVGAGIADLSYRQIRLELKAESSIDIDDKYIERQANQLIQYVVGTNKRIGVLCILDANEKTTFPAPAEAFIKLHVNNIANINVPVISVVIQGGLVSPSDLSR